MKKIILIQVAVQPAMSHQISHYFLSLRNPVLRLNTLVLKVAWNRN